jgi:hypothetical protein
MPTPKRGNMINLSENRTRTRDIPRAKEWKKNFLIGLKVDIEKVIFLEEAKKR